MSPHALRPPAVRIEPQPERWAALARDRFRDAPNDALRRRRDAGLPDASPVVMTGHQPTIWHAGILAKYLAADACARADALAAAWLVVDQDAVDPAAIRAPVTDQRGALAERLVRLAPAPPAQVPALALPPITPAGADLAHMSAQVRQGVQRIADAFSSAADAPSLAAQAASALESLLAPLVPASPTVFASRLAQSDRFHALVERMRSAPEACAGAYNCAAQAHPDSGVRPLRIDGEEVELPLWRVREGRARAPVRAADLASIPAEQLAPRALLMTALVRLDLCDLFVHGSGGALYDRVTERWIADWLGETLAPTAVASADLLLPLASDDTPTPEQADAAVWRAHAAAHNPSLAGDDARQAQKSAIVARIAAADESARPHLFRELHELLRDYRAERRAELDRLADAAEHAASRLEEARLAADRTWPFPLHADDALRALHSAIADRFRAPPLRPRSG